MTSLAQRIAGREVFIHDGKEISPDKARDLAETGAKVLKRVNGPHHDSKWARRLLGTDISQNQFRRNRLAALTTVPA